MQEHITRDYGTHEKANARIHELEAQLGIPRSEDIADICYAWDRLSVLEDLAAARQTAKLPETKPAKSSPAAAASPRPPCSTGKPLFGLARAIAANQRNTRTATTR